MARFRLYSPQAHFLRILFRVTFFWAVWVPLYPLEPRVLFVPQKADRESVISLSVCTHFKARLAQEIVSPHPRKKSSLIHVLRLSCSGDLNLFWTTIAFTFSHNVQAAFWRVKRHPSVTYFERSLGPCLGGPASWEGSLPPFKIRQRVPLKIILINKNFRLEINVCQTRGSDKWSRQTIAIWPATKGYVDDLLSIPCVVTDMVGTCTIQGGLPSGVIYLASARKVWSWRTW